MNNKNEVCTLCLSQALDEMNLQREQNKKITFNLNLKLFGFKSEFDSLELINLMVLLEEKINNTLQTNIELNDPDFLEKAIIDEMDVKNFINYIIEYYKL